MVTHRKQRLQQSFRRAVAFLRARLSPEGLYGLYFTAGIVVLAAATWLFGAISEDLITGDPLVAVDKVISEVFRYLANPQFTAAMQFASSFAAVSTIGVLFALFGGMFVYKRLWYWLSAWVLVVGGGILLNLILKNVFDRARPGWADPLNALDDFSFPSGHTMMATLVYGFIAVFVILRLATGWWQALIVFCTGVLVLTVAFSRMYLGAHYLSDVLGAMAAGVGWLAICLIAVETWRRRRLMMAHRNPGPANIPLSTMQESKRSEAKGNGN